MKRCEMLCKWGLSHVLLNSWKFPNGEEVYFVVPYVIYFSCASAGTQQLYSEISKNMDQMPKVTGTDNKHDGYAQR